MFQINEASKELRIVLVDLEKAILGACILENAYVRIESFLQSVHFSLPDLEIGHLYDHQEIFSEISKLYPHRIVDHHSIACRLPNLKQYICELTSGVCNSSNLESHAALLLEIRIRVKFLYKFEKLLANSVLRIRTKDALRQILNVVADPSKDIFKTIFAANHYLKNIDVEDAILKHIEVFEKNVHSGITNLREAATVEALCSNIYAIAGADQKKRDVLGALTAIIKSVHSGQALPDDLIERIKQWPP